MSEQHKTRQELIKTLEDLTKREHDHWKMAGGYTILKNCCIADCSPAIEITDYEMNCIIERLKTEEQYEEQGFGKRIDAFTDGERAERKRCLKEIEKVEDYCSETICGLDELKKRLAGE